MAAGPLIARNTPQSQHLPATSSLSRPSIRFSCSALSTTGDPASWAKSRIGTRTPGGKLLLRFLAEHEVDREAAALGCGARADAGLVEEDADRIKREENRSRRQGPQVPASRPAMLQRASFVSRGAHGDLRSLAVNDAPGTSHDRITSVATRGTMPLGAAVGGGYDYT
jgi:hypothetical protein